MKAVFPHASERRACCLLEAPLSAMNDRRSATQKEPTTDHLLTPQRIEELVQKHPTFGYRRLWHSCASARSPRQPQDRVPRILKLRGWFCHERQHTPRPRVRGLKSRAERSNERWTMVLTRVDCLGGRLGTPGRRHRLPRPADRRVRLLPPWESERNRMGSRGSLHRPPWAAPA